MELDRDTQFVSGDHLGIQDKYQCFIPIFGQQDSTHETWFFGQFMLSRYYTIFDATKADRGQLRLGIAPSNSADHVGESIIQKHRYLMS